MPLDNFITSIKLRLLSVQSNDIVDIYEHINVSDLKIGENKIPITNPQIIRLLKNSSRVYKVSIINEYMGMATISKTGEDYTTTNQYLLGYDTDSSDASSESGAIADADADAKASLIKELHTDGSSESGASAYASSDSELHTDGSSESGASDDSSSESELHTDGSSESGASEDTDASSDSELHTDASSESGASAYASSDSETSMDSD